MNLSNRIYTRKVLFRIVYMYNFYNYILSKSLYVDMADKVDNIVKLWFDKIDVDEFEKYDFAPLLAVNVKEKPVSTVQDYANFFNIDSDDFDSIVSYVSNSFIKNKDWVSIEYDFIIKNMVYLKNNYNHIVWIIDNFLETFKFSEINSVDQAILLLSFIEYKSCKTPKKIVIKEAMMLADTFSGNSSLVNAVLDKSL